MGRLQEMEEDVEGRIGQHEKLGKGGGSRGKNGGKKEETRGRKVAMPRQPASKGSPSYVTCARDT